MNDKTIEGLKAAIRAAKLALFVIRKQGVMPNSSWEAGFERDLKTAEGALAAVTPGQEPQVTQNPDGTKTWTDNAGSETR